MKKYLIQIVIGLLLAIGVIFYRMPQMEEGTAGVIMAISDGFTVIGLLYVCIGGLLFASSTGFFDFFGYAFQRGASLFFPKFEQGIENYYEYKVSCVDKNNKYIVTKSGNFGVDNTLVKIVDYFNEKL